MRCKVMGIVNVTPDSFSDGGKFFAPEEAVRRARNMVEDGADFVDLGGESTRPGATPIGWETEWSRIEPVLSELCRLKSSGAAGFSGVGLSVDTYHPETAKKALALGADVVNCVYAEPVEEMARLCADAGAALVAPAGCRADLRPILPPDALLLDPMIGFGTTREEDLALIRSVPALAKEGRVLVGASRKRIVKKLTGEKLTGKNLGGNLGIAVWCAMNGASVVRVHDVKETVQALRVVEALEGE